MEIICESDYQDIYRIKDGVLLVINKFDYMSFPFDEYPIVRLQCAQKGIKANYKRHAKGCQSGLDELTVEYTNKYRNWSLPKGTVIYHNRPVKLIPKEQWQYQIKTTGDMLSGNSSELINILEEIKHFVLAKKEG